MQNDKGKVASGNDGNATPCASYAPTDCSPILLMFKNQRRTAHFREGQKLWVVRTTGAQAAEVRGKFRGSGRYVKAWIRWDRANDTPPEFKEIPVAEKFYQMIRGDADSNEGYAHLISENPSFQGGGTL